MPRTRTSQSSQSSSQSSISGILHDSPLEPISSPCPTAASISLSHKDKIPCPFKISDGCHGGVGVKPQTPPLVETVDDINGTVAATLSLETLDLIFQRQITTTNLLELSNPITQPRKPAKKKKKDANLEARRKKLSYGHYTTEIRILSSNGVAPSTPDTLHDLQQKHPYAPPPRIHADSIADVSLSVDTKVVLQAVKRFPKGTSCGRDGLSAQHLLDALSGAAAAVSNKLILSIVGVINLWLEGDCPPVLGEYVASAPLTPLIKPGGGLRPIAVGTIWRRFCSKLAAMSVCKEMTTYLRNHQFSVGIPCGSKGILHSTNRLIELKGDQDNMTMLLIDFTNAFNLVDRTVLIQEVRARCPSISRWVELCYSKPARLYYNNFMLSSGKGVQQGYPLGSLLFSLILHPLVNRIASECTLDLHTWYINDGTIACDTLEVAKALRIIQQEGPTRGLLLNVSKTEIFWPTIDLRKDEPGVFPSSISKPYTGVKVLGGSVIRDAQYCNDMVLYRVVKSTHLMNTIKKLQDPQKKTISGLQGHERVVTKDVKETKTSIVVALVMEETKPRAEETVLEEVVVEVAPIIENLIVKEGKIARLTEEMNMQKAALQVLKDAEDRKSYFADFL
ncbi:uncharacterized protein LOC113290640 [Papaver somniferum]|uniref:uncharacterized protein LOC113290640 n=1 Tax=Papaver somniferum TaxID=3469 RepID=UPI000E6FB39A|nr:uncharacterized protein LOC113290640 [Papaver somniferum]